MNFSYQHANPSTGGGSYLLKFSESTRERTPCILVDSGVGVDLDSLLDDDEYLAAVLLTHAHLDHYASLSDSVRDGAPVYAAEPTANALEDVLTEGEKNYEIGASDGVLDALEPMDGWERIVPEVEVEPIPAGHTPGAAGFVVRFEDGSRTNTALFTGDFTTRRVAGYPGIPTDLPVDIDVLFVNVSTTSGFEETISDSLFTVVERARAGSSVLATASALTGLHAAYLLGHLGERLDEAIPVTLAGQAAKLYADFDYEIPNVETVPVFDDPTDLLERGTVTIAGPEVPVEGGSRRLYEAIEDDSSATLVQLTGGATNPFETAACTVYDFEIVNHPSTSVIDELVEEFDPIHVVAGHGPRQALRKFRGRYDERFVWASDDDREQILYADGRWSPPPWLSETAVQSIRAQDWRSSGVRFGELEDVDRSLPAVARADDADLEDEGLAVERFVGRFGEREDSDPVLVPDSSSGELSDSSSGELPASDSSAPDSPALNSPATDSPSSGSPATDSPSSGSPASGSSAADTDPSASSSTPDGSASDPAARDSPAPDHPEVDEAEAFRAEVLDRLDALESTPPDSGRSIRARIVDGGDGVTLLRLLENAELEHGEEVTVVVGDEHRDE